MYWKWVLAWNTTVQYTLSTIHNYMWLHVHCNSTDRDSKVWWSWAPHSSNASSGQHGFHSQGRIGKIAAHPVPSGHAISPQSRRDDPHPLLELSKGDVTGNLALSVGDESHFVVVRVLEEILGKVEFTAVEPLGDLGDCLGQVNNLVWI